MDVKSRVCEKSFQGVFARILMSDAKKHDASHTMEISRTGDCSLLSRAGQQGISNCSLSHDKAARQVTLHLCTEGQHRKAAQRKDLLLWKIAEARASVMRSGGCTRTLYRLAEMDGSMPLRRYTGLGKLKNLLWRHG